jgi:branched-chain amino acid transport system substrate-binding protein
MQSVRQAVRRDWGIDLSFFKRRALFSAFILACLPLLSGCGLDYEALAKLRLRFAELGQGAITFVAIEEAWSETYLKGIKLAVAEVNAQPGKLLGRPLQLDIRGGGESFDDARFTLLKIAVDPSVTAVLGHRGAKLAIPASVIYEASNIVFIPPFATAKGLTGHDFKFVFRLVPNNKIMAEQLASVAQLLGYRNAALLYAQDEYSRELAFLFDDAAVKRGIGFLHRRSFSAGENDYRQLITQFSNKPIDMVFLSADGEAGGRMVKQLREMGVTAPILGGESLNSPAYEENSGAAGDNTITPMVYLESAETRDNRNFIEKYAQRFGAPPDQNAALGYDSIRLLAGAIARAKSTTPLLISSTLHYQPYWTGVTGVHAFDAQGEVTGKKYFFQARRDGQWHFLPALHLPYFLERFDRYAASQAAGGATVAEFSKAFSMNLHPDDLRVTQLDFLHEILKFKKLGVVYAMDEEEKFRRVEALGKNRDFQVNGCALDTAASDAERGLNGCLGKLAVTSDTLNMIGLGEIDRDIRMRALKPLQAYKIPVLSLHGDAGADSGAAIGISRFGDKNSIETDDYVSLLGGIVRNVKVYELAEKLDNLPVLAVNLKLLNEYGFLRSGALMGLAPDLYLEWLVDAR